MGDPAPRRFSNLLDKGVAPLIRLKPNKPIRAGALVSDRTITTSGDKGRALRAVGRIKASRLPSSEEKFGRVYVCPMQRSGSDEETELVYVKEIDLT